MQIFLNILINLSLSYHQANRENVFVRCEDTVKLFWDNKNPNEFYKVHTHQW